MNYKHKHLLLVIACIIFAAILPFFVSLNWWAGVIVLVTFILAKAIGSEIGAHRLWSHRSFSTSPLIEKILIILHIFAGEGSVIAFAGMHRLHHQYSDTELDPHSPKYVNWWAITFYQHRVDGFDPKMLRDLLSNPWLKWQHRNYFTIHLIIIIALLLASPLALWYYAVTVLLTLWANFLTNIVCHTWGDRDLDTPDRSTNNKWASIWLMGVHLHNNHHANAGAWDNAWGNCKLKFDIWGMVINLIRKKSPVSLLVKDQ